MNTNTRTINPTDVDNIVQAAVALAAKNAAANNAAAVVETARPELLRAARVQLLDGLRRNPFFDPTGIVATRLVTAAIDAAETDGTHEAIAA